MLSRGLLHFGGGEMTKCLECSLPEGGGRKGGGGGWQFSGKGGGGELSGNGLSLPMGKRGGKGEGDCERVVTLSTLACIQFSSRQTLNQAMYHMIYLIPDTDTPGIHLHHRLPHLLTPEELKEMHPRRRLKPYYPPAPEDLAQEEDAESAGSSGNTDG